MLIGCSSTEEKPVVIEEPEPVEVTEAKPVEKKEIRVKASHPRQYTVKKGDTLWDISSMFLQAPW